MVRYKNRPAVVRTNDRYKGVIQSRLEEFPLLSAVRVYEEVQAAGYEGGYTQVKEYVRQVRPSTCEAVVRFETAPGH